MVLPHLRFVMLFFFDLFFFLKIILDDAIFLQILTASDFDMQKIRL